MNNNGPTVSRSPASTGTQDIFIIYSLQRYANGQWVQFSTATASTRLGAAYSAAQLPSLARVPNPPKGSVRVVEYIYWFAAGTSTDARRHVDRASLHVRPRVLFPRLHRLRGVRAARLARQRAGSRGAGAVALATAPGASPFASFSPPPSSLRRGAQGAHRGGAPRGPVRRVSRWVAASSGSSPSEAANSSSSAGQQAPICHCRGTPRSPASTPSCVASATAGSSVDDGLSRNGTFVNGERIGGG